jgi:hypothetical protein
LDFRRAAFAKRVQVAFVVADFLNRQGVQTDAHFLKVTRRFARQFLRETLAVVVDFFDRERTQDGA